MKRLPLLLALLVVFTLRSLPAEGQVGLYGQLNTTHDPSTASWYRGFTGGLYANMLKLGPARLGLDARGTYDTGNNYAYRSFLAGPRLQLKAPVIPFGPYVQGAIGVGGSKYTGTTPLALNYDNKLQYGVIAGLDYTIFPFVDLRLPEVEYLRSSTSSGPSPTNIVALSAGIVVRLP